ncbi:hypothetical protein MBLNU459_g0545t1 [Dothideomycetes sp. NU459]
MGQRALVFILLAVLAVTIFFFLFDSTAYGHERTTAMRDSITRAVHEAELSLASFVLTNAEMYSTRTIAALVATLTRWVMEGRAGALVPVFRGFVILIIKIFSHIFGFITGDMAPTLVPFIRGAAVYTLHASARLYTSVTVDLVDAIVPLLRAAAPRLVSVFARLYAYLRTDLVYALTLVFRAAASHLAAPSLRVYAFVRNDLADILRPIIQAAASSFVDISGHVWSFIKYDLVDALYRAIQAASCTTIHIWARAVAFAKADLAPAVAAGFAFVGAKLDDAVQVIFDLEVVSDTIVPACEAMADRVQEFASSVAAALLGRYR